MPKPKAKTKKCKPTGEHCPGCGYEFVIFPNGEDERDLAAMVSMFKDTSKNLCIDCLEKSHVGAISQ